MKIEFTFHAKQKIEILKRHGVNLTLKQIEDVVAEPENVLKSNRNRFIAQKSLDNEHILRVVFVRENGDVRIITFYPAKRERYESKL